MSPLAQLLPEDGRFSRSRWDGAITIGVFIAAVFAISGIYLYWVWSKNSEPTDLEMEIAEGAIQLVVIALVGVVVAYLFQIIQHWRDERRVRNRLQLEVFHNLMKAYGAIRFAWFDMQAAGLVFDSTNRGNLMEVQVNALRKGMESITRNHLEIDTIRRSIILSGAFSKSAKAEITGYLKILNVHPKGVIEEWMLKGHIFAGATAPGVPATTLGLLPKLQYFFALVKPNATNLSTEDEKLRQQARDYYLAAMEDLEKAIAREILKGR